MKLLFIGYFNTASGYGNSAVNICMGLERLGIDVYPAAVNIDIELPREFTDLFTKRDPLCIDILVAFLLPDQLGLASHIIDRIKKKVFFSMWEQTRLSSDLWRHSDKYNDYTEMWVPCEMNKLPFGEITDKHIEVLPLGVDTKFYRYQNRDWNNGTFRYCQSGALGYRKGTFLVFEAFREIKEEHPDWDIELHLKASGDFCNEFDKICSDIFVYEETWSLEEIRDFYGNCHCMVAPSCGEGFHQPPLEFMSTGGVVVTTAWSGMAEWARCEVCLIVDHTLEETVGKWGGALPDSFWASPNMFTVKSQMEFAYLNRDKCSEMGKAASKYVAENFDWDISCKKMKERLEWLLKQK